MSEKLPLLALEDKMIENELLLGDPERLPKEVVLKRAADLAEALYAMPRGGLGGRGDLGGRTEGYNYSQLAAIQHDTPYDGVEDYNRQNSSPRYFFSNIKFIKKNTSFSFIESTI